MEANSPASRFRCETKAVTKLDQIHYQSEIHHTYIGRTSTLYDWAYPR